MAIQKLFYSSDLKRMQSRAYLLMQQSDRPFQCRMLYTYYTFPCMRQSNHMNGSQNLNTHISVLRSDFALLYTQLKLETTTNESVIKTLAELHNPWQQ